MKIVVEKNDLLAGLMTVQPALSTKSTLPVLNNVLVKAIGTGTLELVATDLEVSLNVCIKAKVEEEGEVTIPGSKLIDIVKCSADNTISINSNGDGCVIKCGKAKYSLAGISSKEFPVIETATDDEVKNSLVLSSGVIGNMLHKTRFSVSTDESRYQICGILMEIVDKEFSMVSTDGRRMSWVSIKSDIDKQVKVILPVKCVGALERILSTNSSESTTVIIRDNAIVFLCGTTIQLISRVIDGAYPNYKQVVPEKPTINVEIDKNTLLEATKRVSLVDNVNNMVKYTLSNNKLNISCTSPEGGTANDEVDIVYAGEELSLGLNARFMKDVLSVINDDKIVLGLGNEMSPIKITPVKDNGVYVIMPMKI